MDFPVVCRRCALKYEGKQLELCCTGSEYSELLGSFGGKRPIIGGRRDKTNFSLSFLDCR